MKIRTQVGIIGAGPAGMFLAHLLRNFDIEAVILEHRSQAHVEGRVRAGLLEQNTVDIMKELGLDMRLKKEGQVHDGVKLSFDGHRIRIPFAELTGGRQITIYGQKEVIKDLTDAWLTNGGQLLFNAPATKIEDFDTDRPQIHFEQDGLSGIISCDFVAACDGFHGISRRTLPTESYRTYNITYPFGWLGILAEVAPSTDELIYAYHERGFALHSLRTEQVSRLYLQVDNDEKIDQWPEDRIWEELAVRLGTEGWSLQPGLVTEKGITPMRSFMIDPMQTGSLFLAGDAAHIVPPTGGKGMNLAVADVKHLADALRDYYRMGSKDALENYSQTALKRVWRAQDFSNFMTRLMHKQDEHGSFQYQLQKAKFDYISISKSYAQTIAENYVGLPFEAFKD